MNAPLSTIYATTRAQKPAPPRSIRAGMRTAIALLVETNTTRAEAAREAGVSEAGLYKAVAKPDVQEYMEALETWHIEKAEKLFARGRADAILRAHHLMHHAKSETVQARMVEFFTRAPDQGKTSVVVNNTIQNVQQGYAYVPKGSKVVEIDSTSSVDAEVIEEKQGDSVNVDQSCIDQPQE